MLNPNSQYIQNARQRGVEQAAVRGGVNSSIAAGASERAALEAAAPLAQQAVNIQQTREGVNADNWAASQNFNRAFLGQLGTTAFSSSVNMLQNLQQMAAEDPELYTPEVTSGLNNFFKFINVLFRKETRVACRSTRANESFFFIQTNGLLMYGKHFCNSRYGKKTLIPFYFHRPFSLNMRKSE